MRAQVGDAEVTDWRRILEWPWAAYHALAWFGGALAVTSTIDLEAHRQRSAFRLPLWWIVAGCVVLGYLVEAWERHQEIAHTGHELEHPLNRWVVDPLISNMAGALLGWVVADRLIGVLL